MPHKDPEVRKAYFRDYYQAHREYKLAQHHAWYRRNREAVIQWNRDYNAQHKEHIRKRSRAYYEAHREQIIKDKRSYHADPKVKERARKFTRSWLAYCHLCRQRLRALVALDPAVKRAVNIDVERATNGQIRQFHDQLMEDIKHGYRY